MKKENELKRCILDGNKKLKEQNLHSALNDFLQAQELDPENPEIHYYLGITYARMANYESAVEHLENILGAELAYIHNVHVQMILGYIYTIQEEYEKALPFFQGILKAGFDNAQAYAAIGYIMDRLGNLKEAVMNLYRAVELDPDNANAHNSLGYIYAEAGLNLEEALEECKKAVTLDENNPAYLDSLGWVYYKIGKIGQAQSYLKKALKIAPENAEILNHLHILEETLT